MKAIEKAKRVLSQGKSPATHGRDPSPGVAGRMLGKPASDAGHVLLEVSLTLARDDGFIPEDYDGSGRDWLRCATN
jgi:hypothetical protein